MPQNRRSEPPHPESEEGEEEATSEEEEGYESVEEEEEEEEEDENKTSPPTPVTKKTPASKKPELSQTQATAKTHSSSSSDSSDGSESDSDSDSPPEKTRKAADPNIKPLALKPMDDQSKSTKKPRSKLNSPPGPPTPAKSGAASKRPPVNESTGSKRTRRKLDLDLVDSEKKAAGNSMGTSGDDSKKQWFQRLWSEDDEIAILQGMIDYAAKKKADPFDDLQEFLEYIKNSLHVDVSKRQLSAKVRRLKKKFENNASKGEKGKERTFAKAHEQKAYELSNKIWGKEGNGSAVENVGSKASGTARKTPNQRTSKVKTASSKEEEEMEVAEDTEREVNQNALFLRLVQISKSFRNSGLDEEEIVKEGLELITGPKRIELEEKWKKLRVMETELFLERLDLIREQTKVMLDTLMSGR